MQEKLYGGIEFGGTKTICAVGHVDGQLTAQQTILTTTVDKTFAAIYRFFNEHPISALGVGTFGPLNLDTSSSEFGYIYNTPKPEWSKVNIKGLLEMNIAVPISIDTDVNCAALGELYYGNAKGVSNLLYLTVGTGIGAGLILDGRIHHGILNLEMGHIRIAHEPFNSAFRGICQFHEDCFEGIASGPAMQERYSNKAEEITDASAWQQEAKYIGIALHSFMLTLGPEKIVLGGGVIGHPGLIEAIRRATKQSVNGYLQFPDLDSYIVKSSGDMNGVLGAIKLVSMNNS